MELASELKYRCSIAFDFILTQLIQPNRWIDFYDEELAPHHHRNFTYQLYSISMMITASELLGRHDLLKCATKEFDKILGFSFSADDRMFLLKPKEDISQAQWNALASIIALKLKREDMAKRFSNSALLSLRMFEPEHSSNHQHSPAYLGMLAINFMQFQKRQNNDLAEPIAKIMSLISDKEHAFYGSEAWALAFCPLELQESCLKKLSTASEYLLSMGAWLTSPMLATIQQTELARYKLTKDPLILERCKHILYRQFEYQLDGTNFGFSSKFKGGFIASATQKNIRLDYVISNAASFLQYLEFVINKEEGNLLDLSS